MLAEFVEDCKDAAGPLASGIFVLEAITTQADCEFCSKNIVQAYEEIKEVAMTRWIRAAVLILFVIALTPVIQAGAQTNADCLFYGEHSNGARYCITMPLPPPYGMWNGDLVIFAHGYVDVNQPVDIPWSQMTFSDGMGGVITMPFLLNSMGYAFATTSYSENGLAIQPGISDILDLIDVFTSLVGTPAHVFLVGASEGGLITTLALERHPESFTGGLAACGPIGSFTGQVNYWGDFRVVFDYFMDSPKFDALPGNAVNIPSSLMKKWDSVYVSRITSVLMANPLNTQQLLAVTGAPVDPSDPNTIGETTLGILWYNVFATNDATDKLGGRPFDNLDRVYANPLNPAMDDLLNAGVERYKAQPSALEEMAAYYETSGLLMRPLVTMHTTGDPIVPFWHQDLYTAKVLGNNPLSPYVPIAVDRYGHCSFTVPEILNGFGTVVYMSTGQMPPTSSLMLDADIQAESYKLSR
jgi:pimeloyl-ACP methyl ester carboxylesterase